MSLKCFYGDDNLESLISTSKQLLLDVQEFYDNFSLDQEEGRGRWLVGKQKVKIIISLKCTNERLLNMQIHAMGRGANRNFIFNTLSPAFSEMVDRLSSLTNLLLLPKY